MRRRGAGSGTDGMTGEHNLKTKWVYSFGAGKSEGEASMRNLLGGKGANLAEMANLGLPVPPGFTVTTQMCTAFFENDRKFPEGLDADVDAALAKVGAAVGKVFGDPKNPLLVSERSGDARFAYDSYRRFIQMYSNVVLEVDHYQFEEILDSFKEERDYFLDTELKADDWKAVIGKYKAAVRDALGRDFPQDPREIGRAHV